MQSSKKLAFPGFISLLLALLQFESIFEQNSMAGFGVRPLLCLIPSALCWACAKAAHTHKLTHPVCPHDTVPTSFRTPFVKAKY